MIVRDHVRRGFPAVALCVVSARHNRTGSRGWRSPCLFYLRALMVAAVVTTAGCGGTNSAPIPPAAPTPDDTANVYILPNASVLGPLAFGDHPLVIYKGERMRWRNIDDMTHALVADTAGVPDFLQTDTLAPGAEQSFLMARTGTTTFHCTIHPSMVGTLMVQER
jgi:plastocyanin